MFSVSDEILKKRFNKILVRLLGAQWIAASCTACGANQCKYFIKDDKVIYLWKALL